MKTNCTTKQELVKKGIERAMTQGVVEVVIREGQAITEHHPENVNISGAIDAPSRWIESRKELFKVKESFTMIDRDSNTITTIVNEQATHGRFEIVGSLVLSKYFTELGINSPKSYSPVQLANVLKLRRSIFPNKVDHGIITSTLRNIKAKINKEIEDLNDQKGNRTSHFEQSVQSNMPDQFEIEIPLIKGEPKSRFFLNVILEVEGGSEIKCFLESIDAQEMIDEISEERINEEVEKIKDYTTIIEK